MHRATVSPLSSIVVGLLPLGSGRVAEDPGLSVLGPPHHISLAALRPFCEATVAMTADSKWSHAASSYILVVLGMMLHAIVESRASSKLLSTFLDRAKKVIGRITARLQSFGLCNLELILVGRRKPLICEHVGNVRGKVHAFVVRREEITAVENVFLAVLAALVVADVGGEAEMDRFGVTLPLVLGPEGSRTACKPEWAGEESFVVGCYSRWR